MFKLTGEATWNKRKFLTTSAYPHWKDLRVTSTQPTDYLWRNWRSETSEKLEVQVKKELLKVTLILNNKISKRERFQRYKDIFKPHY